MIKNILIIGHSNIGDVCYDLAVVRPLRGHFSRARICFFTSSLAKNIVDGYEGIEEIIIFDKHAPNRRIRRRFHIMRILAGKRFDLAVVLKDTFMPYFLGIPRVWHIRKDMRRRSLQHVVDTYLEFLRGRGIETQSAIFNFGLSVEGENFCNTFFAKEGIGINDRLIGIFPLAAWSLKNWSIDKWNKLSDMLLNYDGIKIIAFGKASGSPYDQAVFSNISSKIKFAQTSTLKQAMALINKCSLFIGPDSSLVHLASCMGVETIGLYGPTSWEYIYPYFHKQGIIVTEDKLHCQPCYPRKKCLCKESFRPGLCMERINPEKVFLLACKKLNL